MELTTKVGIPQQQIKREQLIHDGPNSTVFAGLYQNGPVALKSHKDAQKQLNEEQILGVTCQSDTLT